MADAQRKRGEARGAKAAQAVAPGVQMSELEDAVARAEDDACEGFGSLGRLLASRAAEGDGQEGSQDARLRGLAAQLSRQLGLQATREVAAGLRDLSAEEHEHLRDVANGLAGRRIGKAIAEARRCINAGAAPLRAESAVPRRGA